MEQNKWLFPVRMESSNGIIQVDNIVEALGKFKKPIDENVWENLLRRNNISATTEENQQLLRRWWQEGWKETPTLPQKNSAPIPVLQIQETPLGPTLHTVFGTLVMAAKELGVVRDVILRISDETPQPRFNNFAYKILRQHNKASILDAQERRKLWTHFSANNIILGSYPTQAAMAKAIGTNVAHIAKAHKENWNELPDGTWIWCDDWGMIPISPRDELMGLNWRQKCASPISPQQEEKLVGP